MAASLSQAELASRARISTLTIVAYESGARTPRRETLRRLLQACDSYTDGSTQPQVRRGAGSLRDLALIIQGDLQRDDEQGALRLFFGFADDFRGSSHTGRIALIRVDPPLTSDARFDAALAGVAEFFAAEAGIPPPRWVNDPSRFVEPWWFVASRPAFHAYTLAHTPAVFARHGVFMAREVFDRA